MHSFWFVLLVPALGLAGWWTRDMLRSFNNLTPNSAARIWRAIVAVAGLGVLIFLAVDLTIWIQNTPAPNLQKASMRILFCFLTATDIPLIQSLLGVSLGWWASRKNQTAK